MKRFTFILCLLICSFCQAQDVQRRLLLFGDAGEINSKQSFIIRKAQELQLNGKTTAFFMGDNIYPLGMALQSPESEQTAAILASQFTGFRALGIPVYFLAGNHDWDKSGKDGLAKVQAQEAYLKSLQDPDLHFVPKAGSLGPQIIPINNQVIVIAYDSEYWLFPHHKQDIAAEKAKFIEDLKSIIDQNQDKTILLMSHHPMETFGEHSLKFNWRDHLFPLTQFWKPLYLPLPAVGSLYPFIRSTHLKTAEDIKHPQYQELVQQIQEAVGKHPHLVFASGHDHGLQFIDTGKIKQIVSGSGSKTSAIRKDKSLKYRYEKQGFCVVDVLDNRSLHIKYYIDEDDDQLTLTFETTIDYPLP